LLNRYVVIWLKKEIKKFAPSGGAEIKKLKIGEKFCFIIAGWS